MRFFLFLFFLFLWHGKTKSTPNPTCLSLFKFIQVGFQSGLEFDNNSIYCLYNSISCFWNWPGTPRVLLEIFCKRSFLIQGMEIVVFKRIGVIRNRIGIGIIKRIRRCQNSIPIRFNRIVIPVFCTNIRFETNILVLIG